MDPARSEMGVVPLSTKRSCATPKVVEAGTDASAASIAVGVTERRENEGGGRAAAPLAAQSRLATTSATSGR